MAGSPRNGFLRCADQDALNKLFDGHKQLIDPCWNTYPDRMTSTTDIMCTSPEFIAEWKNCLKDPFLVHFAAVPKPWDYPMIGFGDQWWDVRKKRVLRGNHPSDGKSESS